MTSVRVRDVLFVLLQVPLSWGLFSPAVVALDAFDILLASDVLYESAEFDGVFATIRYFMDKKQSLEAFVGYQIRRRAGAGSEALCGGDVQMVAARRVLLHTWRDGSRLRLTSCTARSRVARQCCYYASLTRANRPVGWLRNVRLWAHIYWSI